MERSLLVRQTFMTLTTVILIVYLGVLNSVYGVRVNAGLSSSPTPTASFQPEADCRLPCWQGIVPGELWEHAHYNLTLRGLEVVGTHSLDANRVIYTIPLNLVVRENDEGRTDRSGNVSADVFVEDEIVQTTTVHARWLGEYIQQGDEVLAAWEMLAPINLLSTYGYPDRIDAVIRYTDSGIAIAFSLYWFSDGIGIGYSLKRFYTNGPLREVCLELESVSSAFMLLYTSDSEADFREYLQQATYSSIPNEPISENIKNVQTIDEIVDRIFRGDCLTVDVSQPT